MFPPFSPSFPRHLLLGCYQGDVYVTWLALPTERSHLVYGDEQLETKYYRMRTECGFKLFKALEIHARARVCMWVHMCAICVPVFSTHIHTPNTEVVWHSRAIMIIYLRRNARSLRRLPVAGTVNDYSSSQRNHGYGLAS